MSSSLCQVLGPLHTSCMHGKSKVSKQLAGEQQLCVAHASQKDVQKGNGELVF